MLNAKRGISAGWIEVYFFDLIYHGPLRASRKILLERFHAVCRPLRQCFYCSIGTVANVTDNLVSRGSALREETIPNSLHFTLYEKLSRYLHLKSSPCLPFSSVNTSSSAPSSLSVNVILLPLIDPT